MNCFPQTVNYFVGLCCLLLCYTALVANGQQSQRLVCYWLHGNGPVGNLDPQSCTHIHYSFLTLDPDQLVMRFGSPGEIQGDLKQLLGLKAQYPQLKIVAALGGGGDGGDGKYGRMVTNQQSRARFVREAVKLLLEHGLDGLDFDWEYPACPQTVCDDKHAAEKPAFAQTLKELRAAFDSSGRQLSLSVAVNAGRWLTDKAYDYPTMASACDYINVMTYDNAGSWSTATGHHSGFDWSKQGLQMWSSQGIPKQKLLLGVPFYGIAFQLKNSGQHGLNAPIQGPAGALTYRQVCQDIRQQHWIPERSADGPIAYHGLDWVGYDDPTSAYNKAKWVRDNGFGGILVWEVSQDDIRGECCTKQPKPMIRALAYGLFGKGSDPSTYGCP
ncbi:probable chitinase 10 [Oppia nitens]|uniref:probable chitinase 10 n=1 Tax=Oppia nitens TaxID=1686743 RepID=UPI0023DB2047|nr:probable chitinase 10 [Oppia nitens]